jgi:hypothetical protein
MAARRVLAPCPFPIATTAVSRVLIRLYGRLLGEIAKSKAGERVLIPAKQTQIYLNSIEALMPLLGKSFNKKSVRANRTRPRIGPLEEGDLTSGILAALRDKDDWLSYQQIAESILATHSIKLIGAARKHFLQKLREATHDLGARGFVVREKEIAFGDTSSIQRWRLCRERFRR